MKKLKIAVTGGIGSGKSVVCELFAKKGCPVFSSDLIAKELMNSSEAIKKKIIKNFGQGSYKNGRLDKAYLSEKVFSDPEKTKLINSIVHPATTAEASKRAEAALKVNDIVFIESALVYEAKIHKNFDYVILVYSTDEIKLQRVIKRDNTTEDAVKLRMENQFPDDKKREKADFVIKNDSTVAELEKRAEFILLLLKSISAGD